MTAGRTGHPYTQKDFRLFRDKEETFRSTRPQTRSTQGATQGKGGLDVQFCISLLIDRVSRLGRESRERYGWGGVVLVGSNS